MYTVNKTLLQLLGTRRGWEKLWSCIPLDRFDKEVRLMLNSLNKYWRDTGTDTIDIEAFSMKFFLWNTLSEEERVVYKRLIAMTREEPDPDTAKVITRELRLMEFNKEVEDAQNLYALGEDIDLYERIRSCLVEYEQDVRKSVDSSYCTEGVQEIIEESVKGSGLLWSLDCLNAAMPDLRTGKQVLIGARPGKGKTSFVADQVMGFLRVPWVKSSGRPIVWFNNEGKKITIKGTCLRAALRKDFEQIAAIGWDEAEEEFNRILGGSRMLQIYDIHGKDHAYLERIIDKEKPSVVVWDMLDNVRGFTGTKGTERQDQRLEALYQWARESAVIYDFLSLPTSQVSVEGAGLQWIPDSALKDSKTGKQGACDAILTIGTDDRPGFERSRFMYFPKTKSQAIPGAYPDCRTEVVFNSTTSNFLNPKVKI